MKNMWSYLTLFLLIALSSKIVSADGYTIGVSWANLQEKFLDIDEAAMIAAMEASGDRYVATDAQSSADKQIDDIESLIAMNVDALIVLAQDPEAIKSAIQAAADKGIPVVGYNRLIENPAALYVTFDDFEVGKMQARAMLDQWPKGNYAFIRGPFVDQASDQLFAGQMAVFQESVESGDIKIVGERYTDGWKPAAAQKNMEQLLVDNGNKIDAVMASNDETASGVISALTSKGLDGSVSVSGQGGDAAALNRVARGTQAVTVWKDTRQLGKHAAIFAGMLADGITMDDLPGSVDWNGGPNQIQVRAVFIEPFPITQDSLGVVIEAGWVGQSELCEGAPHSMVICR